MFNGRDCVVIGGIWDKHPSLIILPPECLKIRSQFPKIKLKSNQWSLYFYRYSNDVGEKTMVYLQRKMKERKIKKRLIKNKLYFVTFYTHFYFLEGQTWIFQKLSEYST